MSHHTRLDIEGLARPGLEPVTLAVEAGSCIAVSGPSGSGKSLFLRALADLDPNEGEVRLDGKARSALPAPDWRRQVVYVATDSGWWADTVAQHFHDWAALTAKAEALGLPAEAGDWPVERLSTGERQRLSLLRALEAEPAVLLLDEPTSGLDPRATEAVEALIKAHRADGGTIVMATHDAAQAERLADARLCVEAGRIRPLAATTEDRP